MFWAKFDQREFGRWRAHDNIDVMFLDRCSCMTASYVIPFKSFCLHIVAKWCFRSLGVLERKCRYFCRKFYRLSVDTFHVSLTVRKFHMYRFGWKFSIRLNKQFGEILTIKWQHLDLQKALAWSRTRRLKYESRKSLGTLPRNNWMS